MSQTRSAICALFLLALLLAGATSALSGEASAVTAHDLLAAPDKWHGRPVILSGTVTRLEPRTSQRGNPYFTFRLADHEGGVTVFSYGTPELREGQKVQIEGTFLKVKRVGKHTFQNQVDATRILPL